MKRFFDRLFGKDDWQLVWDSKGEWLGANREIIEYTYYYIYYSPCRRRFKLTHHGYKSVYHTMYNYALNIMNKKRNGIKYPEAQDDVTPQRASV